MEYLIYVGLLIVLALFIYFTLKSKLGNNIINVETNVSSVPIDSFEGDLPFKLDRYKDSKAQRKIEIVEYKRTHVNGKTTYKRKLRVLGFFEDNHNNGGWYKLASYDIT